jgi:hypothetical protein
MSVASAGDTKDASELADARGILAAVWHDDMEAVLKHDDIVQRVARYLDKSNSTAKRKFRLMLEVNLIKKAPMESATFKPRKVQECHDPDKPPWMQRFGLK